MYKIVLLSFLILTSSLLANPVASITALRGEAKIQRGASSFSAVLGASLQNEDTIVTQKKTRIQAIFADESIITIGNNSVFSIREYLYEDADTSVAEFSLLKGAIKTITGRIGKMAPKKFTIHTKTATIGIRGTSFSLFLKEDGSLDAFCHFGAILVILQDTEYLVPKGSFIELRPHAEAKVQKFSSSLFKTKETEHFQLQASIPQTLQIDTSSLESSTLDIEDSKYEHILDNISKEIQTAAQTDNASLP